MTGTEANELGDRVRDLFLAVAVATGDDEAADAATVDALMREPGAVRELVRDSLELEGYRTLEPEAYHAYAVTDDAVEGAMADPARAREMVLAGVRFITCTDRAEDRRDSRRNLLRAFLWSVTKDELGPDAIEAQWRDACLADRRGEPEPGELTAAVRELMGDYAGLLAHQASALDTDARAKLRRGQSPTGRPWRARLRRMEARRAWLAHNRPVYDRLSAELRAAGLLPQA